jgi:hypothetical protein
LEGAEADARTDIFALGAVMYEMVTGRKAFTGKSQASLISAIMSAEPPAISTLQPLAPAALDHVVRTCLAEEPEARRQTAHDVLLELRWIAGTCGCGARAGHPPVLEVDGACGCRVCPISGDCVVFRSQRAGTVCDESVHPGARECALRGGPDDFTGWAPYCFYRFGSIWAADIFQ